eukprot:scaffold7924_cov267-Pinguiococcus_pyrenoidosus.AAC.2
MKRRLVEGNPGKRHFELLSGQLVRGAGSCTAWRHVTSPRLKPGRIQLSAQSVSASNPSGLKWATTNGIMQARVFTKHIEASTGETSFRRRARPTCKLHGDPWLGCLPHLLLSRRWTGTLPTGWPPSHKTS